MKMRNLFLLAIGLIMAATAAGQGTFTYDDIAQGKFAQKSVAGLRSMNDGEHYTVMDGSVIRKYSYRTGDLSGTIYDASAIGANDYQFSADERKILLRYDSKPLYRRSSFSRYEVYDIATGFSSPLTGRDSVRFAAFSPAGDKAAFVYANNIYVKDFAGGKETQITFDGRFNHIINGLPDWVYEEEFYLTDALRWSPDGSRIVYLRSDESQVRESHITMYDRPDGYDMLHAGEEDIVNKAFPYYPSLFSFKYPKAGGKNSIVGLHVYDLESGRTVTVDVGPEEDQYVPYFGWTPDGRLYFFRINRLQNHLEIILASNDGSGRVIYEERSPEYIDDVDPGTITFLSDARRFIIKNETRTGFAHLYMYDIDKGFRYAITAGEWEVTAMVYATDKKIWFLSDEGSPLRRNLYSVDIDGRHKKRLTPLEGTYRITPSRDCKYYISYFSNAATPNTETLHSGDGKLIRTLEDNAALKEYIASVELPRKEFFTFTADIDGTPVTFNCYMVKPRDFDPSKQYPLLLTQYSGPASQEVLDRWMIDWEDALVQRGYIVACMDPRGTGGRGEAFKKLTYGRMGELETADQIAFAQYMASQGYIDPSRVGIYGWSYGGFMSLNCILHGADTFRMAISVAPVTSWRYYDSVYTERVNGLPQDNAAGYDDPSPINHASKLKGKLLLMHGSADDNVSPQNTYKMALELVRAGKQFDMMIYPGDNHSMVPHGLHNIRRKMVEYCVENL